MASNPDKRSKAALGSARNVVVIPIQVVDHATEVSRGSHVVVKIVEPSVKGRGGQTGARSLILTKENLRIRRHGELRASFSQVLAELGQNSSGDLSKGVLLEDTSFPGSVLHSSDGETMYEFSDEDERMDVEEVQRPLAQ
ncbi:hypothetical protein V6N13_068729 [Hibiscus sabdariffa]|uniref:Uncharacterized protein n=1 Tax=Hibiscus sabdariffa TaxID=183260 RepID=A0ABR2QNG3_9ROSI